MVRPLTFASLLLLAGLFALITGCATSSDSLPSRTADRSDPISVLAVGDSLMVGAESQLADSQPGIVIDAKEGRSFSTGIDVLETHLATTTPDVVVFALGTNNGATPDQIAAVMDLASDVDEVVFVNVVVPRTWQTGTNLAMLEAAASYTNASIADWYAESNEADELFRSDGYHLSSSGVERWVTLIIDATQS
jgi:lysophospholipase L1-like esterase